jgi:hypothetical protein
MPDKTPRSFTERLKSFLASELCFRLIVCFFVLEALWIAFSGLYPMAFDENFHLGIIKLYAHHPSPFWTAPPPGTEAFGPVSRDPSYLYQWLMSFPHRVISVITENQTTQVIFLRLINIGLFASALPLYRRLLLKTGASRTITHFCLALFVLIPIAPLLAAQINYDNLFIPLTAITLLLTIQFNGELSRGKVNLQILAWLAIVVMLVCLVKYAFLPIALAIGAYLLVRLYLVSRTKMSWRISYGSKWWRLLAVTLLIFTAGLFAERYMVNLLRYHKPVPSCEKVLSIEQCKSYGPWNRDYKYSQLKSDDAQTSPFIFTADWFYAMWFRTFFAVDGPATTYETRGPLIMPSVGAIIFLVISIAMTLSAFKQTVRRYNSQVIWLFVGVIIAYTVALWVDGYQSFLQTGRPVALNGRYLLPVYPLLIIVLGLGVNVYLKSRQQLKLVFAGLALLCMVWGGGALTYILRSNDVWYWRDTPLKGVNHTTQDVIGPIVPGNAEPRIFMGRHGT